MESRLLAPAQKPKSHPPRPAPPGQPYAIQTGQQYSQSLPREKQHSVSSLYVAHLEFVFRAGESVGEEATEEEEEQEEEDEKED